MMCWLDLLVIILAPTNAAIIVAMLVNSTAGAPFENRGFLTPTP
jgi:uncharacterized membrane protein